MDNELTQTAIALAEQYMDDPIVRTSVVGPIFHHAEQGTPKANKAFTCEPEEAWDIYFDARVLGPAFNATWGQNMVDWRSTQIIVEVGRRDTVLSVERHVQVAPVAKQLTHFTAPTTDYHAETDQETGTHAVVSGGRT